MNKKFLTAAVCTLAAAVLSGCTMPTARRYSNGNNLAGMSDSYSFTPVEEEEEVQQYDWLIQPSISADNIITFDGSTVDTDNELNKAYRNYSVIRQNGRYGLIDFSGNMILKAEYDDFYVCYCGEIVMIKVVDEREGTYEYAVIDADKKIADAPEHKTDVTPTYYWDTATSTVFYSNANEKKATEYTGKKAVAVTEATVSLDDYGNYTVSTEKGAKCGLAKKGELLTELEYTDYFAPGYKGIGTTLAAFKNDEGKWGYLDSDGNVIIDFICDGDPSAYNGKLTDSDSSSHPYLFYNEYVPVYSDGYYSYYNYEGECVVKSGEFEQARPVVNGRAWVKQGELWGVIQLGEIEEEERIHYDDDTTTTSTFTTTTWWAYTAANDPYAWSETTTYSYYDPYYDPNYTEPYYDPNYTEPYYDPNYTEPYYDPNYTEPYYDPNYTEPYYDPNYQEPANTTQAYSEQQYNEYEY